MQIRAPLSKQGRENWYLSVVTSMTGFPFIPPHRLRSASDFQTVIQIALNLLMTSHATLQLALIN